LSNSLTRHKFYLVLVKTQITFLKFFMGNIFISLGNFFIILGKFLLYLGNFFIFLGTFLIYAIEKSVYMSLTHSLLTPVYQRGLVQKF
jgi:hypothetical protein